LASGEVIGAFALSEPNIGSDAYHVETTAAAQEDGYRITGKKKWTTYGQVADLCLTFAQLDDKPTAFLVERTSPGLAVEPLTGMLGTRAAMLAELTFDDCVVPQEGLLGRPGLGMQMVGAAALDLGRYSVAWGCLGIAQDCLAASVRRARRRKQFGKRLHSFQLIKQLVARMYADVSAAMLICVRAGRLRDASDPDSIIQTCLAKFIASTTCSRVASDAVQIYGAVGCSDESPVQRHFRDARITEIIEGSTQMQELMIADHVASSLGR
jgi:alkylation response protein AidB-like acyl-CoA dehydrogenase